MPDAIRFVKEPQQFLSLLQVEEHIGLGRGSLSKYRMPDPDAIIGPVKPDGTLPRGTTR